MIAFPKPLDGLLDRKVDDLSFAIRLMEYLIVPTFVIDRTSRVVVWNKACERLTGLMADDVVGTDDHWRAFYTEPRLFLPDLLARGDYQAIGSLYGQCDGFGMSDFGVSVESWCLMPQRGRQLYLAIDAGPIYDDAGALIAVVETVRDITAQHEAQQSLLTLAAEDGLTGLPNRRSFDELLKTEVRRASREDETLSLLMVDVDCFKAFNDTYGHQSGDDCLRAVAQAMAGALHRAGDTVARYGGEEFAVVLPKTDTAAALQIAERLRIAIEDLGIRHEGSRASEVVTASLGAATGHGADLDADRLVAAADSALYVSKHEGRNRSRAAERETSLFMF